MRYKKQLTVVTLIGSFVLVFAVLAIADPRDADQRDTQQPATPSASTAETPRAPEPSALRSFDPFSTQPNTPSEVFVPTVPAPATLQPQGSQPGQPCYQPTTRHRAPSASWNSPWRNGPELIVGNIAIGQLNLEDNQQLIKTLIAALVRTATLEAKLEAREQRNLHPAQPYEARFHLAFEHMRIENEKLSRRITELEKQLRVSHRVYTEEAYGAPLSDNLNSVIEAPAYQSDVPAEVKDAGSDSNN